MDALISLLIVALVIGLILALALWVIGYLGMPEPFAKIATIVIVVVGVLIFLQRALPLLHV